MISAGQLSAFKQRSWNCNKCNFLNENGDITKKKKGNFISLTKLQKVWHKRHPGACFAVLFGKLSAFPF